MVMAVAGHSSSVNAPSSGEAAYAVLCAAAPAERLERLARDLRAVCPKGVEVIPCDSVDAGLERIGAFAGRRAHPLAIIAVEDARYPSQDPPVVSIEADWNIGALRERIGALLTERVLRHDPQNTAMFVDRIDPLRLAEAFADAELARRKGQEHLQSLRRIIHAAQGLNIDDAENAMIEGVDRALDKPPRLRIPADTVFLEEGKAVNGIWIVLEGRVQLTRRAEYGEVVFLSGSVGRIVGLLAMTRRQQAFFSCRTVTDTTAIHLTWHDLDRALVADPSLTVHFMAVLIDSLHKRFRRTSELQLEIEALNNTLGNERDRLAGALRQLRAAQSKLIETEKMATLGQLVAGVAHELNNPMTAIRRAIDYVLEDVLGVMRMLPDAAAMESRLRAAMTTTPVSTAELRFRRQALVNALRDEELVRRLMKVGITTLADYEREIARLSPVERDSRLAGMERAHQLGQSIRNIRSSSERVSAIVKSLRSHARPNQEPAGIVNLHEGLEDTLMLFSHRMRGIEVERVFGWIPPVECHSGQINQVWTNLISNALDAMGDSGKLTLETDRPDADHVRVRIIDNGPGISPEHQHRIFDVNFTTKHGGAAFGLGMGLLICRQIVQRHGGTIAIDSAPGRTAVSVVLPVQPPKPVPVASLP